MIAADTSTWIAFFHGDPGADVELLDRALSDRQVLMPPAVLTELFGDSNLDEDVRATLAEVPLRRVADGVWQRAVELRAVVLAKRRKARLGDALIARSCIDASVSLITRDRDFQAFADAAGLDLVLGAAR